MNPLTWDAPKIVVYLALFGIVFCRSQATYWIGRGLIAGLSHNRLVARRLSSGGYLRARAMVERYGAPVVAVSYLTVGFQTLVILAAGAARMPMRLFIPAQFVGCTLWALLYGTIGFVGFEMWLRCFKSDPLLTCTATAAILAGLVGYFIHRGKQRSKEEMVPAPAGAAENV